MTGTHVVLAGSERPRKHAADRLGDVDPSERIEVTLTLRGPALPEMEPGHSMSREELQESFGASQDDIERVEGELRKYGLRIDDVAPLARTVRVSGTAAQIQEAFHARLGIYRHENEGEFRGREGSIEIPAALEGVVTGVFGLDQRRVARRRPGTPKQGAAPHAAASRPLAPADLEKRYEFPQGDGSGQVVAIAEFGGAFFPDDLATFCRQIGRPVPNVQQVGVGVAPLSEQEVMQLPAAQRQQVLDMSGEVNMDVQIIAGLCPAANIVLYFSTFDEKGWVDLIAKIIDGQPESPVAVSVSWGLAEDAPDWSPAARTAINERLQAASALGITFCVSSGDDGSGDQVNDGAAHIDFPASSPYALAVGGTMLNGADEVVWWQPPGDRADGGGSSGGGVSTVFARPAWQTVKVKSLNAGSLDGRVIPDVAALAGPPFYQLVLQGQPAPNGGTSAAAPLWAALIARSSQGQGPGAPAFLAPLLYQAAAGNGRAVGEDVCRDIVAGDNRSPQPGPGYRAGPGFDAVTGWGVPAGSPLRVFETTEARAKAARTA